MKVISNLVIFFVFKMWNYKLAQYQKNEGEGIVPECYEVVTFKQTKK
jgi:hypothetical protein